jgi:hypothetical protein
MRSGETITSSVTGKTLADIEDIYESSEPVKFEIAYVNGANQRTKIVPLVQGSVIVSTLTLNGPNRQNADYTTQLTGVGDYTPVANLFTGTFHGGDPSGEGDWSIGPIEMEEGQSIETLQYTAQFRPGEGLGLWDVVDGNLISPIDEDGIQRITVGNSGYYYISQKSEMLELTKVQYVVYV